MVVMELYQDPDLYDAAHVTLTKDVRFYRSLAREAGGPILELGAGSGRVMSSLASEGIRVVGVDLSFPMLQKAHGTLKGRDGSLVQMDFRHLAFKGSFRLVLAAFNSLQHVESLGELCQVMRQVGEVLENGGIFAFDVLNEKVETPGKPRLRERFFDERRGSVCEVWESVEWEPRNRICRRCWNYTWANGETVARFLNHRMHEPDELEDAVDRAGLKLEKFLGDFDGGKFSGVSARQILICRKI